MTKRIGILLALASLPASASAQSFNVDFGTSVVPSPTYAAAGLPGTWNPIGVLPSSQRAPLVGLDGASTSAKIYMIGGTALLDSDDPATAGDDDAFVDDMLIGFNDPVDVCIWFEGLTNGDYQVLLYALTPNDPALECRLRVDFGSPGPVMVGGAWPGFHKIGVSYEVFTVTVTDGTIGLHSGLWAAEIQSGLNGIQLLDPSATSAGVLPPFESEPNAIRAIFPNPARGEQVIELAGPGRGWERLEIFDLAGRLVWSHPLEHLVGDPRRVTWNGQDLRGGLVPASVYFVRVKGAAGPSSAKLVRID